MTKDADTSAVDNLDAYQRLMGDEYYGKLMERGAQLAASKSASFEQYRLLKSQESIKKLVADPTARVKTISQAIKELHGYVEEVKELESSLLLKTETVDALKVS